MRKLTAGVALNPETFQPTVTLLLDGADTGVALAIMPVHDLESTPQEENEQAFIDIAIDELNDRIPLTEEENKHYRANFRTLIVPLPGK